MAAGRAMRWRGPGGALAAGWRVRLRAAGAASLTPVTAAEPARIAPLRACPRRHPVNRCTKP